MRLIINSKTKIYPIEDILSRIGYDLEARYGQKKYNVIGCYNTKLILEDPKQRGDELIVEMEKVKPLLRKMSSMTTQEKENYQEKLDGVANQTTGVWEVIEWLNINHFDYNNLIDQGWAEERM